MSADYTFDVFSSLDGFGSYDEHGDWGGYWGKQGPEFLARRLAQYEADQRLVLGAGTFREFVHFLGRDGDGSAADDPINARMKGMPTTVVSTTLDGPLDWPDATLVSGDAVLVDMTRRAPNPPGIFVLDDGMGLVAKRLEHIPNSDPPAVRVISDNKHYPEYERTADEIHIVGRIRWFAREI